MIKSQVAIFCSTLLLIVCKNRYYCYSPESMGKGKLQLFSLRFINSRHLLVERVIVERADSNRGGSVGIFALSRCLREAIFQRNARSWRRMLAGLVDQDLKFQDFHLKPFSKTDVVEEELFRF